MYLLYIDESGTSSIPGNTSHFVLAGVSAPIWHWKDCDREISLIKQRFRIPNAEIHTGWILRKYLEQSKIPRFSYLTDQQRRYEVEKFRKMELLRLQRTGNPKHYKQTKKNYAQTQDYIHLTFDERQKLIIEIAECISNWGFARLFAECIDKVHFDPSRAPHDIDTQAFEQIVSRFEQYLENIGTEENKYYGLLIHDNNETVAKKHTDLMIKFHKTGTLWTHVKNIIETPLFVNSELTSLVQIADLCAYALRRYLENNEDGLFSHIFKRADRKGNKVVGVRHFSPKTCTCEICTNH